MKGYQLRRVGGPESLKLSEIPDLSAPEADEVRVRVQNIGINFAEILSRKGQYSWAVKKPYTLGMECYGQIEAVGESVSPDRVGEYVICGMQYGAYAEHVNVREYLAFPAFDHMTPAENAAMLVNYTTAWISLFAQARVQPGETVLVQAAAGGVGTAAVQLLKAHGCTVVGMASRKDKLELLDRLGVDLTINYRTEEFDEVIREKGMHPDVVLELVGGEVFHKSYSLVKPFGRIAVAGFASIPLKKWNPLTWIPTLKAMPRAKVMDMARRSIGMYATHIGYLIEQPELVRANFYAMADFVREHDIKPIVGKEFDFAEVPAAHSYIEARKSYGKVVLNVN